MIKIGCTNRCPQDRLSSIRGSLQRDFGFQLPYAEVVGAFFFGREPHPPFREEGILHKRFAHLHIKGEWFRAEPDLLEFIEKWTQWSRYPCRCGNCWTTPEEIQYFLAPPL